MKSLYPIVLLSFLTISTIVGFNLFSDSENEIKYLDPSQKIEDRVNDLIKRMTLEEKVGQMSQYVGLDHMKKAEKNLSKDDLINNDAQGFYPNLHSSDVANLVEKGLIGSFLHVLTAEETNYLQKLAKKSRLKIPLLIGIDAIHGNGLYTGATVYPSPISLAASFDTSMVRRIGQQTAIEMRATGTHWTFTPNVDVSRDPRWGRVGETFGEDPLLVSDMGVAKIVGLQNGSNIYEDKVIACAKHLIAGSTPINGLNASPMDVSERTLREVYLPPYKAAIEAGVYSIMAAHNELNGIPCHADKWMMNDILREEMEFKGFYVSDWMDMERIHTLHKVSENIKEGFYLSINAGMDMHMHGPEFLEKVVLLVEEGKLPESRIDEAVQKILIAKFQLGLFEQPLVDVEKSKNIISQKDHVALALESARKSIVMLKNEDLLPLKSGKTKRILVTGPNANNQSITGDWVSNQPDDHVITVLEGIKMMAPPDFTIDYFNSGEVIGNLQEKNINNAVEKAKTSDFAVIVVGENSMRYKWKDKTNGENKGRANIELTGDQIKLIKRINNTGTPILVVIVSGRPLGIPWISDNIPAILYAWEPGNQGGKAIGEIIFGKTNPSGKLPISLARSVGQVQTFYNHKPSQYFHKYVFEKTGPLYTFGYGMSFTSFEYQDFKLDKNKINTDESTHASVKVTNTGTMKGDEIIQLYVRDDYSSATRPVKELKGYKRISLEPGQSEIIHFEISPEMLSFYDVHMNYVVEPGDFTLMVGKSSDDKDLKKLNLNVM